MQLTFSRNHLGYIANFLSDKQLFFKVKSAWINTNPLDDLVTIPNLTLSEISSVYQQMGGVQEGIANSINLEIKAALLPQLMENGQPANQECAELLNRIAEFTSFNTTELQNIIAKGTQELNQQ